MHYSRSCLLFAVVGLLGMAGCASPFRKPMAATEDGAYIQYWGQGDDRAKLRVAVKDLIDMKGVVTTAGSEYLAKHRAPAAEDAECLRNFRRKDIFIVGKTNLTEFAIGTSGVNEYFGTPINPMGPAHIPGGSSCGSAVAVSNGTADIALGTDTAGSIRVPAACCGIAGLKTTFGLISSKGVYPISAEYLDTIGPMARDVEGLVLGMDLLQPGFAARYKAVPDKAWKIGRLYVKGADHRVDEAVDAALQAVGFEVVRLPDSFSAAFAQAQADGRTIAAASAYRSSQALQLRTGVTVRSKSIMTLGLASQAALPGSIARRAAWQEKLARVFQEVDLIALPTMQRMPPNLPWFSSTVALEALVLRIQNTTAFNYSGNPAVAIPIPLNDHSIVLTSLQLVGPMRSEAELLRAGQLVEGAYGVASD